VDAAVEVGEAVRVEHPLGQVQAEVTTLPFLQ
jgi:hypothetical protein